MRPHSHYREHTILLKRERVNKGTKRMNSLPLSSVVKLYLMRPYREKRYLQILRNTVGPGTCLDLKCYDGLVSSGFPCKVA